MNFHYNQYLICMTKTFTYYFSFGHLLSHCLKLKRIRIFHYRLADDLLIFHFLNFINTVIIIIR